jgi:hypothetical protein
MSGKSRHNEDSKLIELLGRGVTKAEAARQLGMSSRTVSRRLEHPGFNAQVVQFRAGLLESATGRLASLADAALDSLQSLLSNTTTASVRLQASKCVLETLLRYRESLNLEARIVTLESRLQTEEARPY